MATNKYSIEHILPQKLESGWDEFNEIKHSQHVYRLANMIILEKSLNRNIGNIAYKDKKIVLSTSSISLTSGLADKYDSWTPETINSRQKHLATQAKSIWMIN